MESFHMEIWSTVEVVAAHKRPPCAYENMYIKESPYVYIDRILQRLIGHITFRDSTYFD